MAKESLRDTLKKANVDLKKKKSDEEHNERLITAGKTAYGDGSKVEHSVYQSEVKRLNKKYKPKGDDMRVISPAMKAAKKAGKKVSDKEFKRQVSRNI